MVTQAKVSKVSIEAGEMLIAACDEQDKNSAAGYGLLRCGCAMRHTFRITVHVSPDGEDYYTVEEMMR